jgi:hypothetical protein
MATPELVTVQEFTESQYAQLVESNADLQPDDVLVKAEAAVQSRMGRRVLLSPYTERFNATSQSVFLRRRPVVEVTSIKRRSNILFDWTVLNPARVEIESGPGYITS